MNQLFSFDINVVLFHLFTGFLIYINIVCLGISCLRILRENLNPVLIYPSGLFFFCLLNIIFWNFNLKLLIFLLILIFLLLINLKYLIKYYNNFFDTLILFILACFLAILNSTTLHDPDSQNNTMAFGDTYYYISKIHNDLIFFQLQDQTLYGFDKSLSQQMGALLAYPFRNFELFRPILHFSISIWILSLFFIVDIFRKNIKINFANYQILILTILIYFSLRTNFYLDESLPTILTLPLIFLLSFFLFEDFKKEKIIFEIFLAIITIILCYLTKQVLLLMALPILFLRGVMSKEKKIVIIYFTIFLFSVFLMLLLHQEHFSSSLNQVKLSMPSFSFGSISLGLYALHKSVQLLLIFLLILLTFKNIKLLLLSVFSIILFFCTQSGGPFLFWLILFLIYSTQRYEKSNFLNLEINNNFLILIIFLIFIITYYFFQSYHIKLGIYFLFFLFLFTSLNISHFSNTLKVLILLFAVVYPLSFSKKIPSKINFIMKYPLDGGITYLSLSKNIEQLVPENSLIFTDIGAFEYNVSLNLKQKIEAYRKNPAIMYLSQSKRQFYVLSSYSLFDQVNLYEKFLDLERKNYNTIYKEENFKNFIKNEYYKNFYILIDKQNINKIIRYKKNIEIIDKNYALIDITKNNY